MTPDSYRGDLPATRQNPPVPDDAVDLVFEERDVGLFIRHPDDPTRTKWIGIHRDGAVALPFE